MKNNRILELQRFGQSIWLDYIRRDFIAGGELGRFIGVYGLRGMTSNPAIFEKAILSGDIYSEPIRAMSQSGKDSKFIYEALSQSDVQAAADVFKPVYDRTSGNDGYVSLEVNPHLAFDTEGTIKEARRLWTAVDRPNILIKVPATAEGLPAIRQLISEGINVNVTLIFGVERYLQVANEYIAGIMERIDHNEPVNNVVSFASFFLSRIDSLIDPMLEKIIDNRGELGGLAQNAYGQVAIASAKTAYQHYKNIFESDKLLELAKMGVRVQRMLWASTGAKNPKFSELKYVEPLIGRNTVSTLPLETFNAYCEHGKPKRSIEDGATDAEEILKSLPDLGVDIDEIIRQLELEGIKKFTEPFDKLLSAIDKQT
ncbi:MAG: transaldolase [Firmicutes bacterium HGW-Firmicutes-16]|nr:MAG: transaldolase [Firmicutes bacterium HGW-Firmicutes-16]